MNLIVSCIRIFLLFFGLVLASTSWPVELVPLYLYNTPPPFNTDTPDNLSDHLAKLFSKHSNGKYKFEAIYLPRKRLDELVAGDKWRGAVIWANPVWFKDPARTHFLWSDKLTIDYNLVLSHKNKPVEFVTPDSLKGLRLGGILGHVYSEFDAMEMAGSLTRDDTTSYQLNLLKLKARRVDVIFFPASAMTFVEKLYPDLQDWLYISKRPRNIFHYYMFCDPSNTVMMAFLDKEIRQLKFDTTWQHEMKKWQSYHLSNIGHDMRVN